MGHIEELVASYKTHIAAPWQKNLAGAQKTIFVVYPKTEERRLRARLELFEMATTGAGHGWLQFDFTPVFAQVDGGNGLPRGVFSDAGGPEHQAGN